MGRPGAGVGRTGSCGVGHFGGQHGLADHRCRPAVEQRGPAMGGHRVPADVRRRVAARRSDRGPAVPATGPDHRPRGLHHRVPGERVRLHRRSAGRRPRRAGFGCRADDTGGVGDHHDDLRGCATGQGPRDVGSRRRPGHRRGRAGRRCDHHLRRLADDLLGERPDRRRRDRRRTGAAGKERPGPARARPTGPARRPRRCHRPGCARVRHPERGQRRLDIPENTCASCPSRGCCWSRSGSSSGGWRIRWCRRTPGGSRPWSPGRV